MESTKEIHTRREFLKLFINPDPQTAFEKKQNELNREIAEKIYLKRMKSLMLDENSLFNKDVLEGDFSVLQEILFGIKKDQVKMSSILIASSNT